MRYLDYHGSNILRDVLSEKNSREMEMEDKNNKIRIGIVYIVIGMYEEFWKEFYPTCECFFCPDAVKGFEVFTDSVRLQAMKLKNVTWHSVENRGFIWNVSAKSEFICSISMVLREKYDYVFYMNGNYKFIEPIGLNEVLPSAENNFLTALSFDLYKNLSVDSLPYDRNPDCHACMKTGMGKRYYQGGFYGGRVEEIIKLSEWCMKYILEDLNRKIIARWHDESYLNRYLSEYDPYILNEAYGYADTSGYSGPYKAILLDKETYLGCKLNDFKPLPMDNSLSFLLDDHLQFRKIGIVKFSGGLGNQMFQYAFYLYLRKKWGSQMEIYIDTGGDNWQVGKFEIGDSVIVSEKLKKQILHIPIQQKKDVTENRISCVQSIDIPSASVTIYKGYWQCANYVEENREEIKRVFSYKKKPLNEKSRVWLNRILSTCSVSIHVRRGDYLTSLNKEIYGGICTLAYYAKAIKKMKKLLPEEPFFYIFTDDSQWVRKHFKYKNCILVEGNEGPNDWQDQVLMSSCRHHIIANSSFSWWGAWLGKNPEKQIIAPAWWYKGVPTPDLVPPSWIRISVYEPDWKDWFSGHLILGEIKRHTAGQYLAEIEFSIYYFYLAGITHKRIYKKIAEAKLNYICEHLKEIPTVSEFITINQGILYLYNKKYIVGNPEIIFKEVDAYLQEKLHTINIQLLKYDLTDFAGYFVSRIISSGKRAQCVKQCLTEALERTMQLIWEYKEILSERDKEHLLLLIRQIAETHMLQPDYMLLYMYCMNEYDMTSIFFSQANIERM